MEVINLFDYILLPFYCLIFYFLIKARSIKYKAEGIDKHYKIGFWLHILGSIAYALLVKYYYGYGDSFNYFYGGEFIKQGLFSGTINVADLFDPAIKFSEKIIMDSDFAYAHGMMAVDSNLFIMKISALISMFSFGHFLIISIIMGAISFLGVWKLFEVARMILPKANANLLAIGILYSPSACFWGSSIMKESICFGCLGYMVYALMVVLNKKRNLLYLFIAVICGYVIWVVKSYIVSIFILSFVVMLFYNIFKTIQNIVFKLMAYAGIVILGLILLYASNFGSTLHDLAQDSYQQVQEFQAQYQSIQDLDETSKGGIQTAIGSSVTGMILKSPLVCLSTLYRPFLWEGRKLIILISALESTVVLLFTLYLLTLGKIGYFFKALFSNKYVIFCLVFSLLMATLIGFTTFNLGSMVRYRIILIPFFNFLLIFIFYAIKTKEENNQRPSAL